MRSAMRRGEQGGSRLGKVRSFVSPSRRVIRGTLIAAIALFLAALGSLVAIALFPAASLRVHALPSRSAAWAIPFALLVAGELLRRWTNRRLMVLYEGGVSYMDRRTLRTIAWEEVARATLGPGTCRVHLRAGDALDLPAPLAASEEVREALRRAVAVART